MTVKKNCKLHFYFRAVDSAFSIFYLFGGLVKGNRAKEARKRCGVNFRSVGEHGAREAATFTTQ